MRAKPNQTEKKIYTWLQNLTRRERKRENARESKTTKTTSSSSLSVFQFGFLAALSLSHLDALFFFFFFFFRTSMHLSNSRIVWSVIASFPSFFFFTVIFLLLSSLFFFFVMVFLWNLITRVCVRARKPEKWRKKASQKTCERSFPSIASIIYNVN